MVVCRLCNSSLDDAARSPAAAAAMRLLTYAFELLIEMLLFAVVLFTVYLFATTSSADECSANCMSFYGYTAANSRAVAYHVGPYASSACRWLCGFKENIRMVFCGGIGSGESAWRSVFRRVRSCVASSLRDLIESKRKSTCSAWTPSLERQLRGADGAIRALTPVSAAYAIQ